MNGLLQKLQVIQNECDVKKPLLTVENDTDDEFTRLKKNLYVVIKNIKLLIQQRDENEKSAPGSVFVVELSHQIHKDTKEAEKACEKLAQLQYEEKMRYIKRNKENIDTETQIEQREAIVKGYEDHIEECKLLAQKRHGGSAFASSSSSRGSSKPVTALPDIDLPEFQVLKKQDVLIDIELDKTKQGVIELKDMALNMNTEAVHQTKMLENLEVKVNRTNDTLEGINIRLRKALEQVRKGDRFILDIILLCVLLGLIGYIYNIVK